MKPRVSGVNATPPAMKHLRCEGEAGDVKGHHSRARLSTNVQDTAEALRAGRGGTGALGQGQQAARADVSARALDPPSVQSGAGAVAGGGRKQVDRRPVLQPQRGVLGDDEAPRPWDVGRGHPDGDKRLEPFLELPRRPGLAAVCRRPGLAAPPRRPPPPGPPTKPLPLSRPSGGSRVPPGRVGVARGGRGG